MTNRERIKNFNNKEFSEYIYSVFLAGRLYEVNKGEHDEDFQTVDYVKWLDEEEENSL